MEDTKPSVEMSHLNMTDWQKTYGFSQAVAVTVTGGHRLLFLAGVGSESDTGSTRELGDVAAQCRLAWANILEVLAHAGASSDRIVRVRTYVTDVRFLSDVAATRREVFGDGPYPAHTFLVVSALAHPGMLVEIEVDAVVPL
jgi:enamine deaminase RidA (YjgF/YER057c/UK114 family)